MYAFHISSRRTVEERLTGDASTTRVTMIFNTNTGNTGCRSVRALLSALLFLALCHNTPNSITTTMAFPMQIVVSQSTSECLYEQLNNEYVIFCKALDSPANKIDQLMFSMYRFLLHFVI